MIIDSRAHYNHAVYQKPTVIEKIARIKGIFPKIVEQATAENAIRLFQLPIGG